MVILDTDILTIVQFRRGPLYARVVARLDEIDDDVAVSIISFEEQMRGWLSFIGKKRDSSAQLLAYDRLSELLEDYQDRTVLRFDQAASTLFTSLRVQHRRTGTMDLKIAAIAIANGARLATRNVGDFAPIGGLSLVDLTSNSP